MRSLDEARQTCEEFLPGLLAELAEAPLTEREAPDSPAIEQFRAHGGPGLVVPVQYAGAGATPLQALRVTRALAATAPSLAVGTTMHHFSVATLFALADSAMSGGMEWALLEGIARQRLLVGSGFAEGRPGQGILSPTMRAEKAEGGFVVNGGKKPCSLSRSMDLLTASVAVPADDGGTRTAVLLVPSTTPGISVHPFWSTWVLAGAQSDEVRLTDVFIDDQLVMVDEDSAPGELDRMQTVGFIWFELLIAASYLGMASALVERVCAGGRGAETARADLVVRLESATLLLEGVARMVMAGEVDNTALGKALVARYAVQDALAQASVTALELLGGMAFIGGGDVAYLAVATRALAFHPPSRSAAAGALLDHVAGAPLRVG